MVENFNKRIKSWGLTKYRFSSIFELNGKLLEFVDDYNHNKRLKSLNYKTPAQYLKEQKNITLQRIVSYQIKYKRVNFNGVYTTLLKMADNHSYLPMGAKEKKKKGGRHA